MKDLFSRIQITWILKQVNNYNLDMKQMKNRMRTEKEEI